MKRFITIAATLALAAVTFAQGTGVLRYWKDVDRAPGKDEEILSFSLDSDLYAATRDGMPDLRIFDNDGTAVPYLIETQLQDREEKVRQEFSTEIVHLRPDGNALEIHLRLTEKSPAADGLIVSTPLRNYERKVRVAGSQDGTNWTPVNAEGLIFDYSQHMDISSRNIALPKNSFRQFKVTISDITDELESPFKSLSKTFREAKEEKRVELTTIERRPFRIDQIKIWHESPVQEAKTVSRSLSRFEAVEDAIKKTTVITVWTGREPINRLNLETANRNFSRQVTIEVPSSKAPAGAAGKKSRSEGGAEETSTWHAIGSGTIENINFRDQVRKSEGISFPERREESFRIIIQNEDNPPLTISGVKAQGNLQRAVFLAQPGKTYRVFYGSGTLEQPHYEAAKVLDTLRKTNTPVLVGLGAQKTNDDFQEGPGKPNGILNNWLFLGGAITAMVAVLAWSLFSAGKRLEAIPKD